MTKRRQYEPAITVLDIPGRIAGAYHEAMAMQSYRQDRGLSPSIRIHVGQAGWDWLRTKANVGGTAIDAPLPAPTLWGFPVMLEMAWPADRIVVRADVEIP